MTFPFWYLGNDLSVLGGCALYFAWSATIGSWYSCWIPNPICRNTYQAAAVCFSRYLREKEKRQWKRDKSRQKDGRRRNEMRVGEGANSKIPWGSHYCISIPLKIHTHKNIYTHANVHTHKYAHTHMVRLTNK